MGREEGLVLRPDMSLLDLMASLEASGHRR
jgi:hypothetical protein